MLTYISGDLFASPAHTLVNTVNTVGVMGKGIAVTFKKLYPDMFAAYQEACRNDQLAIGSLFLWRTPQKWVLNFPTKTDWKRPSKLEYIEAGLRSFVANYTRMGIRSVAFPPLGCGNGELNFENDVQPLMHRYLEALPIDVFIYRPLDVGVKPEQHDITAMRAWLQQDPRSMPASEVWHDLADHFAERREFASVSGRARLAAVYDAERNAIRVEQGGRGHWLRCEDIEETWNTLRAFGIITRHEVATRSQGLATLTMALLAELRYIARVEWSDEYRSIEYTPAFGIQLVPPRHRTKLPAIDQLALV